MTVASALRRCPVLPLIRGGACRAAPRVRPNDSVGRLYELFTARLSLRPRNGLDRLKTTKYFDVLLCGRPYARYLSEAVGQFCVLRRGAAVPAGLDAYPGCAS